MIRQCSVRFREAFATEGARVVLYASPGRESKNLKIVTLFHTVTVQLRGTLNDTIRLFALWERVC